MKIYYYMITYRQLDIISDKSDFGRSFQQLEWPIESEKSIAQVESFIAREVGTDSCYIELWDWKPLRLKGKDGAGPKPVEEKFITVTFSPNVLEVITAGPFTTIERAATSLMNAGWVLMLGKNLVQIAYEKQPWTHASLPKAYAYIVPVP